MRKVAFALVIAAGACGTAMSQGAFEKYSLEVHQRNEERRRVATEGLKKRGYVLLEGDEDIRYATLEDPGRTRCLHEAFHIERLDAGPLAPDEPLRILIGEATRGGEKPKPPIYVTAPAEKACAFFRQQRGSAGGDLEVKKEDGSTRGLVHTEGPRALARGPNGETVIIDVKARVIAKRKVLVKKSCDHMPRLEPDPLERAFGVPVVWGPLAKLPTVVMTVDQEDIDVECTENTY